MTIKSKKDDIFIIPLKHVNRLGTRKPWAITHENGHKTKKHEFLLIPPKHLNLLGTPKLWAIDHENGHKKQKL